MSDIQDRVALLGQRAGDGCEEALRELDQLICSDPRAKKAWLELAWLSAQLPLTATLCGHVVAKQNQSPRSSTTSLTRWLAIAATLLMATGIAYVVFFSSRNSESELAQGQSPGPDLVEKANDVFDANTLEESAETEVILASPAQPEFNNLAHPANRGGLKGGVVVNDDPLPEVISFNFHVRPILSENCYYCHGPDPNHREADLRLDTSEGAESVVEVGHPQDSELISRILDEDPGSQMPPPESGRVISERQKRILAAWIEQGAKYESHWAFTKVQRPELPSVKDDRWPRNEIDQFVLAKLESKDIDPSKRAEPEVLVRRMYLDLIGLPPTPEQSQEFCESFQNDSDAAIDSLADKLLASEHYGERMALPWLDAARYSDSNGFQQDGDRAQWPWRDWVVDAYNDNMPFDQFTIEQLAGDLLPEPTRKQLIATAFNRNHMLNGEGGAIVEEQRNNYVFDRVDTTATTWLGLTMACAQCHDHKYDPITHEDYYQFFAYFNNVDENGGVNVRNGRLQVGTPFIDNPTEEQTRQLETIEAEIAPVNQSLSDADAEITKALRAWEDKNRDDPPSMNRNVFNALKKTPEERNRGEEKLLKDWYLLNAAKDQWKQLKQKQNALYSKKSGVKSTVVTVMIMRDRKKPRKTTIFDRGAYDAPTEEVAANVPHFLPPLPEGADANRLSLAKWLVDRDNPLTSRVAVNRYWQTFFGIGIVKTSEDFGVQSELPSHPDLLDWLAVEFMESGWDVKHMHRLIVTSETYLQSSRFRADLHDVDPENRLLARSPRFRLPTTLIRDAALSTSGLLHKQIGGPPVYPWQPDGLWREFSLEKFAYKPSTGDSLHRRSLYTFWRRTVAPPNMFDSANRQACTVKLSRTNTPLQALVLLNDPVFVEAFCGLASMVLSQSPGSDEQIVRLAFEHATGRKPNQAELGSLLSALEDSREFYAEHVDDAAAYVSIGEAVAVPEDDQAKVTLASLASVVQIIMNTDEFMTRE
ncbi:PSD1 and planctomycete cytochrome C domain-containing protein [Mariniblastus fucicola]|uniref:Planctomycete cytochrome C n=1 Tax=Mariniblastus fucicola TaxID=980251 RepID=A0A5B9P764_9BACT|nr:PSD1 and planctomycete cytochrome C domain-containing protein [Mariniblastus fucicola]QEG22154.1 Planctomycete cytochrome C [Mariniblastus fucicola]